MFRYLRKGGWGNLEIKTRFISSGVSGPLISTSLLPAATGPTAGKIPGRLKLWLQKQGNCGRGWEAKREN